MATNIHHNVPEVSNTPTNGQPWNFHGILDSFLLPRVIMSDEALTLGARVLWAVIRQYSCRDGRCMLSDNELASALCVGARQCRRYCRELNDAGLLRTTQRDGKAPIRELLWEGRFAGKLRKPPVISVRGGGQECPGGRTQMSDLYKEEGSYKVVTRYKSATIEKVQGSEASSSTERLRPPIRTDEEIIRRGRECNFPEHVIQRDLERARARRARAQDERMLNASELQPETDSSAPRSRPS